MKNDQQKNTTSSELPPMLQKLAGENQATGLRACRWTLIVTAVLATLNLGLFDFVPSIFSSIVEVLQYDRVAVGQGELWRLLTGNFVHWSVEHFYLDVGALLVLGVLYERHLGRAYLPVLVGSTVAVGLCVHFFSPQMVYYRGISGVDSGLFAAILCVEMILARSDRIRWIWTAPAVAIFTVKIAYESVTGRLFFETQSLGELGAPTVMAHLAGTLAGLAAVGTILWLRSTPKARRLAKAMES